MSSPIRNHQRASAHLQLFWANKAAPADFRGLASAIFSENCELKNEIDQLEDGHSQQSKKLNSRVKKLEALLEFN
jgi:uncharacterized protein YfcZ (UPF0381/DUF406 family)